MNRLEGLLIKNNILVDGKIKATTNKVDDKDVGNISSIIDFLAERNEISSLQKWFDVNLDTIGSKENIPPRLRVNDWSQRSEVMKLMGLKYMSYYRGMYDSDDKINRYFNCDFDEVKIMNINEYDYYVPVILSDNKNITDDTTSARLADSSRVKFEIKEKSAILRMYLNDFEIATYDLGKYINELGSFENYTKLPADKSIVVIENEKVRIELNLDSMHGDYKNGEVIVNNIRAKAFVKLKGK
jgi:hypothetical protein